MAVIHVCPAHSCGYAPRRQRTREAMMSSSHRIVLGLLAWPLLVSGGEAGAQTTAGQCAELTKLQVPGVAMAISKAEWFAASAGTAAAGRAPAQSALPAY